MHFGRSKGFLEVEIGDALKLYHVIAIVGTRVAPTHGCRSLGDPFEDALELLSSLQVSRPLPLAVFNKGVLCLSKRMI